MKDIICIFKKLFCAALLIGLFGCQHDIQPPDLEYPPELDETGFVSSKMTPEEAEKELAAINAEEYPAYTVQGGDTFRVRVYNEEDLDNAFSSVTMVTPDGYLVMNLIEPVCIKDLTIVEATRKVKDALRKFIKYPEVSLVPERIQGKSATLLGAIREQGVYPATANTRLSDFVAQGKGFATGILDNTTVDMADITSSYIVRNGKILPVNFTEALINGNINHNIKIYPGDVVYVARREDSRITVIGEVNNVRAMNWVYGLTVLDALAHAGGLKEDYWGTALVLRQNRSVAGGPLDVYKMDVDDLLAGRCRNFRLAAGDIVYIPKDSLSEYNVFIRKLMPTAQLFNLLMSPPAYWFAPGR